MSNQQLVPGIRFTVARKSLLIIRLAMDQDEILSDGNPRQFVANKIDRKMYLGDDFKL